MTSVMPVHKRVMVLMGEVVDDHPHASDTVIRDFYLTAIEDDEEAHRYHVEHSSMLHVKRFTGPKESLFERRGSIKKAEDYAERLELTIPWFDIMLPDNRRLSDHTFGEVGAWARVFGKFFSVLQEDGNPGEFIRDKYDSEQLQARFLQIMEED